ncbi:MAG: Crp/Fnr family transcriptional regulator [Aggregatilineales bacterium]
MSDFDSTQAVAQLQSAQLFKGVTHDDLAALVEVMQPQTFVAGTVLSEKGAPGDTMYLILAGQLRIYATDSEGHSITLTFYGPGRLFGDFALIDEQPRSAAAVAVDTLEVLALDRADFLKFLPEHPSIGLAMLRNLADRVRYITIYLNKINDFSQRLAAGEYERALQEFEATGADDSDIKGLITAFGEMVHSLQTRQAQAQQSSQPQVPSQ